MAAPKRIQRRRTRGWRMPEGAVYVGRPSKWGNPFRPVQRPSGLWIPTDDNDVTYEGPFHSYAAALGACVRLFVEVEVDLGLLADRADVTELRGKDLCCWCPLDSPCHADVLLAIANGKEQL
ncbi:DUF4326 domain-containing protein [Nocardia sp. NPDC003963]